MKSYVKDYPRPQLVREKWQNLNGEWNFAFDDAKQGEKSSWYRSFPNEKKIQVPFTYETKLSGIADETIHEKIWYQRELVIEEASLENNRAILHFEGSDYYTKVWINGSYVGEHSGGYSRFSFDVTDHVSAGKNSIVVAVEDLPDEQQPRGKQRWVPYNFGCWYVQTTGIWKTVWMEYVPQSFIKSVKMTPCVEKSALQLEADICVATGVKPLSFEAIVYYKDSEVNRCRIPVNSVSTMCTIPLYTSEVAPFGVALWSPEEPNLYDVSFRLWQEDVVVDKAESYFGLRDIRIEQGNVLLNGRPLYQRLILDQGYWEDSHLTPPSEEALIEDIEKIQALGYNGLRKHQKTEDERFLYWCDVKGVLVWSEFPAAYEFTDAAVRMMTKEWMDIVKQNYNHPSIIVWTPFNESWGIRDVATSKREQSFTESIYHLTKSFDAMRPVIVNDGWEHTISDIITLHDYEEDANDFLERYGEYVEELLENEVYFNKDRKAFATGFAYQGQPILISEYGGIAFTGDDSGWGYGNKVETKEDFIERFDAITTAIKSLPYVCGYCYTQVSDVQQEVNGLMDIKRNFKVEPAIIKEINERAVSPIFKQK